MVKGYEQGAKGSISMFFNYTKLKAWFKMKKDGVCIENFTQGFNPVI